MARGNSGKVLAEIDPQLKRRFQAALTLDGITFKDWLLQNIGEYMKDRQQPQFPEFSEISEFANCRPSDNASTNSDIPVAAEGAAAYNSPKKSHTRPTARPIARPTARPNPQPEIPSDRP